MQLFRIYRPKYLHIAYIFPLWGWMLKNISNMLHLKWVLSPGTEEIADTFCNQIRHYDFNYQFNFERGGYYLYLDFIFGKYPKNGDQKCNCECLAAYQY